MAELRPAMKAFAYFRANEEQHIRAELEARGQKYELGPVQKELSERWQALSEEEKAPYKELENEDRERYDAEADARDREAEEEQARKRSEREADDVSGPRSTRTVAPVKEDREKKRPKRELTEDEIEERRERAEAKAQQKAERQHIDQSIQSQQTNMKQEIARQAEARLQYLLGQSDIFEHFGVGKERADKRRAAEAAGELAPKKRGRPRKDPSAAPTSPGKHRRANDAGDANEDSELEEDDEDALGPNQPVFLTKQPNLIKFGQMRSYQLEGLNWMIRLNANGINGILADEMGLGKTLQSIAILAYMHEHLGVRGPHVIMVPKSTLSNWMNEITRWCPSIRAVRFHGSKDERARLVDEVLKPGSSDADRGWDVLLTTYEVANMERRTLQKFAWRYLIIDEAHRLKNEASLFSQTVRSLNMQHRLLLTGTPLQNNLHELWALLNFLLPDVFSSSEQFDQWFNLEIDDDAAKEKMIHQLHKILRPFMLRRLKADVEKSLPPKTETILFVGLSAKQKEVYRNVLLRDIDAVNGTGAGGGQSGRTAILNIVMQLRKCCNHPYLFAGVEDRKLDPLGEHLVTNCGKMVLLSKLLQKLQERGNRVLIFSQMTRMLDILEDFCVMRRYEYCRIDGNTSYEDREDYIDAYNKPDSTKFIFMLSTRAGGLGINLQTADTVILFDSDWNPQADLQAMDRAHRIGQKKVVNVFRFVTENTVEEKVVERAQQKLKMDAMIVQQGRLQDQHNKKFSKDELLDALRFGADSVFRSKESSISDEDIDAILAQGEKRTKEMEERISKADKGDMLDFRLDGGMETQKFEGVDYSNRANRLDGGSTYVPYLIDTGKRERKRVQSYKETEYFKQTLIATTKKKTVKVPKHLRLPKMDEWQFFDRKRLQELYEMEEQLYLQAKTEGTLPQGAELAELQVLPPEQVAEKAALLSEGFGDWNKQHYQNFIRGSAKYGRHQYEKIAQDVGKTEEEVAKYAQVFWENGDSVFAQVDWERNVKNIERGEKKIEEINRLMEATRSFMARFENPWEHLTFHYCATQQGKVFNAPEDRYLLCLAHKYGYGAWDQVKAAIRREGRFRFDYFLRSCSADVLGKRCEILMKAAEKENAEWDKRQPAGFERIGERDKDRMVEDDRRHGEELERHGKLVELDSRLQDEAKKLAQIRNAKAQHRQQLLTEAAAEAEAQAQQAAENAKNAKPRDDDKKGTAEKKSKDPSAPKGNTSRVVPEHLIPVLAKAISVAGPLGLDKLVTAFVSKHPENSKRQVEKKVQEMSIKEKREGDARESWYLKDEYVGLLQLVPESNGSDETAAGANTGGGSSSNKKEGAGSKKRKHEETSQEPRNPYSWFKDENREKVIETLKGEGVTSPPPEMVKRRLKEMWVAMDDSKKDDYVKLACKHGYKKVKS